MINIGPRVRYFERAEWGADPGLVRLGGPEVGRPLVPLVDHTHAIIHHSVGVDTDATKNVWESDEECFVRARGLQDIRPDLGLDVPYNVVIFLMADHSIVVCEGRGFQRSGAHTAGQNARGEWHNVTGIASCLYGDFENHPTDLSPWAEPLGHWAWWMSHMMPNIFRLRPQRGGYFFGHRDFRDDAPQYNSTACPGESAYRQLPNIVPIDPHREPEELDMATAAELDQKIEQVKVFFGAVVGGHARDIADLKAASRFLQAVVVDQERRLRELNPAEDPGPVSADLKAFEARLDDIDTRLRAAAAAFGP